MKKLLGTRGFTAIEVILVLAVIALLAGAAYVVYDRQNDNGDASGSSQPQSATSDDIQEPPTEISDTNDLNAAEEALDANDPEFSSADETQLDEELREL